MRYPTGNDLTDQLCEFIVDRFPAFFGAAPNAFNDRPSLAENWWVEDRLAEGFIAPISKQTPEQGLRQIYRWARNRNIETGGLFMTTTEQAANLLLHQVSELIPTMFSKAAELHAQNLTTAQGAIEHGKKH